jgi:peptidase U49-like protein
MSATRQVDAAPLVSLLRRAAPHNADTLEKLLSELTPIFILESGEERILFQSRLSPPTIIVGVKSTCRLQAHAFAGGIFLSALSTPGYLQMSPEQRGRLYAPAYPLLTWAVGRDLQQWINQRFGIERSLDEIMLGSEKELPEEAIGNLSRQQKVLGQGLFCSACAFILLHELAHIRLGHEGCTGTTSILQEKEADRFAAEWLLGSLLLSKARRLNCLFGISIALLWVTVYNVYLGPGQNRTHPSGYDRLFQVLDQMICEEDETFVVWDFVSRMLFVHMDNTGFAIDPDRMQGSPKDEVNHLVDLLSKGVPG